MFRFLRTLSLCVSLTLAILASAQSLLPSSDGDRARFAATIETERGCVTGICVMLYDGELVKGCLFNEFGVTALEFSYQPQKEKVKLLTVLPMLNKWYIRRTLRGDLKKLMHALRDGETEYVNMRRHITYTFVPQTAVEDETIDTDNLYDDEVTE